MEEYKLRAERVHEIMMDCLFRDEEDKTNFIKAEGVTMSVGYHPDRLKSHAAEIEQMLMQLDQKFRQSSGGGWSFLNACMDAGGIQWGEHRDIDELIMLGIGIGKVRYTLPRDMWSVLPGGMPYFTIIDE